MRESGACGRPSSQAGASGLAVRGSTLIGGSLGFPEPSAFPLRARPRSLSCQNEDVLKKCAQEYLSRVKKEEQRYQALKVHAEEKLDR